jgi:hypothetical protein
MKRFLPLIILIPFYLTSSLTYAQTPTLGVGFETIEQGYTSYLAAFDAYRVSHKEYETSKATYRRFHTPVTQLDLLDKGKKVLSDRDEVITTYLNYLLIRLLTSPGVDFSDQSVYQLSLKVEKQFYITHKEGINAILNLSDLSNKSDEAERQYRTTEAVASHVIGIILLGKINIIKTRTEKFKTLLEGQIILNRPKAENMQKIDRWILEAQNRLLLSQNKNVTARDQFEKLASSYAGNVSETFNTGRQLVMESLEYLRETQTFLKQISEVMASG